MDKEKYPRRHEYIQVMDEDGQVKMPESAAMGTNTHTLYFMLREESKAEQSST